MLNALRNGDTQTKHMTDDSRVRGMAAVALTASIASICSPTLFHRTFGLAGQDTEASRLAWRLFAVRTSAISVLALAGNQTAIGLFGPLQLLDQVSWWSAHRRDELPLRTAVLASAASGVIIALDIDRRRSRAASA